MDQRFKPAVYDVWWLLTRAKYSGVIVGLDPAIQLPSLLGRQAGKPNKTDPRVTPGSSPGARVTVVAGIDSAKYASIIRKPAQRPPG